MNDFNLDAELDTFVDGDHDVAAIRALVDRAVAADRAARAVETFDDGGPAFPCEDADRWIPGMSLRQWYAGKAIEAAVGYHGLPDIEMHETRAAMACSAYLMADAMLEAGEPGEVAP